jgi:hypothetical protein
MKCKGCGIKAFYIMLFLFAIASCGKSSESYVPLKEGLKWEFQFIENTKIDDALLIALSNWPNLKKFNVNKSEKFISTSLPNREINNKNVTPLRVEYPDRSSFMYITQDNTGIMIYATQSYKDIEPKMLKTPSYILKNPIKKETTWHKTMNISFEPSQSIDLQATIDNINDVVDVPSGTYNNCLKVKCIGKTVYGDREVINMISNILSLGIKDKNFINIDVEYYIWYAPGVGNVKNIYKETANLGGKLIFTKERTVQLLSFKK